MFWYQTMILLRKPTIFYLFDFIMIAFVNMKNSFEKHKAAVVSLKTRKSKKEVQKKIKIVLWNGKYMYVYNRVSILFLTYWLQATLAGLFDYKTKARKRHAYNILDSVPVCVHIYIKTFLTHHICKYKTNLIT